MPSKARIWIPILLVVQIALPLHYYLMRQDQRDERFAWRMFSPTRIERCSAQFYVGDGSKPVSLSKHFHNAWIGLAKRGRQQVISAMAQRLCDDFPEQEVRVRLQCEKHPRSALSQADLANPSRRQSDERIELIVPGAFNFCSTGAL